MPTKEQKVVLVGEANPYGADPRYALYPYPERSAGHRLCCLILDMKLSEYLGTFDRVNLCPQRWSIAEARRTAGTLLGRYCVLLGAKVCSAFDVPYEPFTAQYPGTPEGGGGLLVLPHPSGRCLLWNAAGAYERARRCVEAFRRGEDI